MIWEVLEALFGYIALFFVFGTMLVILYLLAVTTFLIRKVIAPEYELKFNPTTHKYIWIFIGIVFSFGFVLFLLTLWPIILSILALYVVLRYVFPLVAKRLI